MNRKMNKWRMGLALPVLCAVLFMTVLPAAANYAYDGFEVKNMINGTVQGDIFVSYGNKSGLSAPPFTTYTDVPGGSAVWARLYVGVWGGTQSRTGWVNTTLNGASIGNVTLGGTGDTNPTYSGGTNAYSSGNGVWWVSYNATNNVTMNAQNIATARTGGTIDGRVYAIVLALVYQNTSLPEVQYWANEGNVNLHYNSSAFPYVLDSNFTWFNGSAYNSTEARLNAVYLTGSSGEPDYLYFNPPDAGNSPYGNRSWDISAYRRYQLNGDNAANESQGSYFDFESFISTNDSTALKDIVSITANNYAVFWRGHDDNSDGWISAGFQVSGLEGEAYVHPVLAVLRLDLDYDVSIAASANQTVDTGVYANYTITITNTGNISDTYDLTNDNPLGVTVAVLNQSTITLGHGESGSVKLSVMDDSGNGGNFYVTVKAASRADATVNAELTTKTTVNPA